MAAAAGAMNATMVGCQAFEKKDINVYTMLLTLGGVYLTTKCIHFCLKFLGQSRMMSESIVALIISTTDVMQFFDRKAQRMVRLVSEACWALYFFSLGLEMEPKNLFRRPKPEAILAYAGMLSTWVIFSCMMPLLEKRVDPVEKIKFLVSYATGVSNTSSTVLARLITDLKIGKSELGRLVLGAGVHCDMTTLVVISAFLAVQTQTHNTQELLSKHLKNNAPDLLRSVVVVLMVALQTWFLRTVGVRALDWVNRTYPEGKPLTWRHFTLAAFVIVGISFVPSVMGYSSNMNGFLVGLALPREGRLSRWLVKKINIILTELAFPLYYSLMGTNFDLRNWGWTTSKTLLMLLAVGMVGKVSGTVIAAHYFGYGLLDGICMGLLLDVRGHYQMLGAINGMELEVMDKVGFTLSVASVLCTMVYIPVVAVVIVRQQRKRYAKQQLTLRWHKPEASLRMMVCLQGPHHVPAVVKLIEATKGEEGSWGVAVYAMDLVELTERAAATLTYGVGLEAVEVTDEAVMETRKKIKMAFEAYLAKHGENVSVRHLLVVSSYNTMHQDICNTAQDSASLLIFMPYHKTQRADGTMSDGDPELRAVNKKVLRDAPCSVGILVDRGLYGASKIPVSIHDSLRVAVVFIGGGDDREALCYAARIARSPFVRLTVIRFVVDRGSESSLSGPSGSSNRRFNNYQKMDEEMQLDSDSFTEFHDRLISTGYAGYVEKYVASGPQTIASLRDLQEEFRFNLFILGLSGRESSVLRAEMSDWQECPELGPLGDNLAASDFSFSASVLIIQQHDPRRNDERGGADSDDEFSSFRA